MHKNNDIYESRQAPNYFGLVYDAIDLAVLAQDSTNEKIARLAKNWLEKLDAFHGKGE